MKTLMVSFCLVIFLSGVSYGGDPIMKLAEVKHVGDDHTFLYTCNESGNGFEVEQRYNSVTKQEEVRFLVNGKYSNWLTDGITVEKWRTRSQRACKESEKQYAVAEN